MPATPYFPFPKNPMREALLKREKLIGCWSAMGCAYANEVLGYAGFDWLLIDGEHAPNDLLTIIHELQALKSSPSAPFVRPTWNETVELKRLLDAGVYNFLIPYVQNEEEAKAAVAATRYPPAGVRGVSVSQRSNQFGEVKDYMKIVNDCISVVVQIENQSGVDNAAKIAAVDGIDGLFVGPSDLAAALGHLGDPHAPVVQEAIKHVFDAAAKAGKSSGILAPIEADARKYMEMGANFMAVGSDLGLYRSATLKLAATYK